MPAHRCHATGREVAVDPGLLMCRRQGALAL